MKRTIMMMVCFIGMVAFAQNIPTDSLEYYRNAAQMLLIENKVEEAVELYKKLAMNGDALSGHQLYELYSQGKGVQKNLRQAERWRSLAQALTEKQQQSNYQFTQNTNNQTYSNQELSFEDLLHQSGGLIELGGKEKNIATAIGVLGGGVGGTLMGLGIRKSNQTLTIIGGAVSGGLGIAAIVLNVLGNKHIQQGGELMRKVRINGNGISVSF